MREDIANRDENSVPGISCACNGAVKEGGRGGRRKDGCGRLTQAEGKGSRSCAFLPAVCCAGYGSVCQVARVLNNVRGCVC